MQSSDDRARARVRVGIAGWAIRREHATRFATSGTHLARYSACLPAVEINSSFYKPHARKTYERWAASVPDDFRFAVKVPKAITHERALCDCDALLERFLGEISGLGDKLGPLLVQLPPSRALELDVATAFFACLRSRFAGLVACEPRHATWFTDKACELLQRFDVARVAADPARVPGADEPGGGESLAYFRLHGSPRTYSSDYDAERLSGWTERVRRAALRAREVWCIFDNTALGAAVPNAIEMMRALGLTRSLDPPSRFPRET